MARFRFVNATAQMAAAQNAQREQIDYTAPAGGLYPLLSEYRDAVLSSEDNLDKLKHLKPVLDDTGSPIMSSGNFAVVFKMQDSDGHYYALKCFLRASESRDYNYRLISNQLNDVASPYFVKIDYYAKELFVDTQNSQENEFPVLLMDWVEGKTLDKYIREQRDSEFLLADLAYKFSVFANWIQEQPFAHGDLKPDNIIVRDDGQIVLVDYDGMFVPGMEGQEAREIGSPDFRHPARTSRDFDKDIDYFSLLSILLSLKLISLKPELLDSYCAQDGLLFSAGDYADPDSCPLFKKQDFYDRECVALLIALMCELNTRYRQFMRRFRFNARTIKVLQNPIMADCFAKVTDDDLANAYEDSYGVLYSKDHLRLLRAPRNLEEYNVAVGCVFVCAGAFAGGLIRKVCFPDTVSRIGANAFEKCSNLEEFCLPINVASIEEEMFLQCENLRRVYMPSEKLLRINQGAFRGCSSLIEVDIPDSVEYIEDRAFQDCNKLLSVRLPLSLQTLSGLTFADCESLSFVNIPRVSRIEGGAFSECKSLKSLLLPDSIVELSWSTFAGCSALSTLRWPCNLDICDYGSLLAELSSLVTVYGESISYGTSFVVNNGRLAITDRTITSFIVPNSVSIIPNSAFHGCTALESLIIPASVKTIDARAFSDCASLQSIVLLPGVQNVRSGAFQDCTSLESITLPDSVETIGYGAFWGCTALHTVSLPDGIKSIENLAFWCCTSLESITIPDSVETIGSGAFDGCASLRAIVLTDGIKSIGEKAFGYCSSLGSITIPLSVESIGGWAFEGCASLRAIALPDGIKSIERYAFRCCTSLESITLPSSVESIESGAFEGCTSLRMIVLSDGIKSIGEEAFCNCTSLESIEIPSSVESIKSRAFWGCTSLRAVILPDKIMNVAFDAFEGCPCNSLSLQQDDNLPF